MSPLRAAVRSWKLQAGLLVAASILAGVAVELYTDSTFVQTVVVINGIGGLVIGVYQLSSDSAISASDDGGSSPDRSPTNSAAGGSENESAPSGRKTPPSPGLTPEEQAVQNEMLRRDYQDFYENPMAHFVVRQPSVNGLVEDWDTDPETVQKVWKVSTDDRFYQKQKDTWKLTPKAVDRVEELGEETLLDEDIQDGILGLLLQSYRKDPNRPAVARDTLLNALSCSEDEVDHNVWLLNEKGYVKTQAFLGGSRGYREVEITRIGRRVME